MEDEFAKDQRPIESSYLSSISSASSCNPTPDPALVSALVPALVLTPAPTLPSSNKLFKQFIKVYLESNQGLNQPPAKRERPFKAKVPDIYYDKLHIDCYHFCKQCKNYFETF